MALGQILNCGTGSGSIKVLGGGWGMDCSELRVGIYPVIPPSPFLFLSSWGERERTDRRQTDPWYQAALLEAL